MYRCAVQIAQNRNNRQNYQSAGKLTISRCLNIRPPELQPVEEWVAEQQGKHFCHCGCSEPIIVLSFHRSKGIPNLRLGHHTKSMIMRKKRYNEKGLYMISQAAKMLGIGATSIRRYEGILFPKAEKSGKNGTRLFTLEQIEEMRQNWKETLKNPKEQGLFAGIEVCRMIGISRKTLTKYTGSLFPKPFKVLEGRGTKLYNIKQVEEIKNIWLKHLKIDT